MPDIDVRTASTESQAQSSPAPSSLTPASPATDPIELRVEEALQTVETALRTSTEPAKEELDGEVNNQEVGNIALAPEEIATLQLLVARYDLVLQDLNRLNDQLESLLASEGIKGCES